MIASRIAFCEFRNSDLHASARTAGLFTVVYVCDGLVLKLLAVLKATVGSVKGAAVKTRVVSDNKMSWKFEE